MDIFKALADKNRRKIIESLYQEGELSIKQLTANSTISRQAITKHLNILIKAKVISAEFTGKERVHILNPKAVQSLVDWISPFAAQWDNRLNNLAKHIGEQND